MPSTDTAQERGQSLTIREADTHGRVKCNRCKKKLKGGESGDARRDQHRPGYVCREGC